MDKPAMSDNELFTRLWTKAEPIVASYVGSMVHDFHACEDLLQEIAVVLLRKFDQYDPDRPFISWALGIAKLEILAKRRSHARSFLSYRQDLLNAFTQAYEELTPELSRETMALRHCISKVKGRNNKVLRLRYEESLKPKQIAERLNLAAGTVRVILSRVRNSLRNCVQKRLARQTA